VKLLVTLLPEGSVAVHSNVTDVARGPIAVLSVIAVLSDCFLQAILQALPLLLQTPLLSVALTSDQRSRKYAPSIMLLEVLAAADPVASRYTIEDGTLRTGAVTSAARTSKNRRSGSNSNSSGRRGNGVSRHVDLLEVVCDLTACSADRIPKGQLSATVLLPSTTTTRLA